MGKENKTKVTEIQVSDFINSFVDDKHKREDSLQLIELMKKWSGFEPKMWGPTIIGFGSYHYKYASGHEGDCLLIGFSPRKKAFSLYVYTPQQNNTELLNKLGKFKIGKACIYINKLLDIDLDVLEVLCKSTIHFHRS
ncbi:DUF1801 domain-containing protein [Flavobacterium sp.]|jgi:hypothetical protein|uniref:DUF1801 domain-containing protein n=1 Tax=Flavobacterium sp. TaxID=239 RepID=UPI0008C18311|nr:DUF1801 domain-containing protein [Flavobacterium sp.]OGS64968.1 MAG: hypothetical protein A2X21_03635 [Flavobacteria bacterium GWA2_35_26]HCF03444.1 DUF1801 domain-containing protein [Flavobacterium sp.]